MEKIDENGKKNLSKKLFFLIFFHSGALIKSNNQQAYLKHGNSASTGVENLKKGSTYITFSLFFKEKKSKRGPVPTGFTRILCH